MAAARTLPDALARAADAGTGLTFVVDGVETRRSYADLRRASRSVARALAESGVRRGDLVAIVLDDAEAFLTALFGASIGGFIPASLPVPPAVGEPASFPESTARVLRASRARALITTLQLARLLERDRASFPDLVLSVARESLDAPPIENTVSARLDDVAFVQFTSGSSSAPKGVALTHANLAANIDAFNGPAGIGTTADDIGVSWLPLNHDMGLVGMVLGPIYAGRPVVLLTPQAFVKRPVAWLQALTRHQATVSFAPNFAYDLCVRRVKDLTGLDLSRWRVAGCGAEPIHPPTLAAFAAKFAGAGFRDTSFLPSYGLAEHVLAATFAPRGRGPRVEQVSARELTDQRVAVPPRDGGVPVSLVSCGSPLPGHRLQIADDEGRPLPDRHVGEILLAGPSVMRGYYEQEALTAATIRDGWLRTGDLGYRSGGELFVCGRAKDLIIANGRKYHPQDLEWAVDGLPGVRRGRVVAFAATHHGRPDRIVIVAEPRGTVAAAALSDAIRRQIADAFGLYVDDVALVPGGTVGRTTSGKVQRAATRARYERGELVTSRSPAPASEGVKTEDAGDA
jgi:fatty-acyl-CoA synthase